VTQSVASGEADCRRERANKVKAELPDDVTGEAELTTDRELDHVARTCPTKLIYLRADNVRGTVRTHGQPCQHLGSKFKPDQCQGPALSAHHVSAKQVDGTTSYNSDSSAIASGDPSPTASADMSPTISADPPPTTSMGGERAAPTDTEWTHSAGNAHGAQLMSSTYQRNRPRKWDGQRALRPAGDETTVYIVMLNQSGLVAKTVCTTKTG
jgi:hypothetical protein